MLRVDAEHRQLARSRAAEQRCRSPPWSPWCGKPSRRLPATRRTSTTRCPVRPDGSSASPRCDLQQIQAQLAQEVATLKRITIERRAAWEQTFQDFGTRLSTLETQLDHTRREAAVDPLTNVANRRTFEQKCREWLKPNRPGFVLAIVDVDDFKTINDRHGHAVGDRVLVAVAETLVRSLRADDLVARLGGDEFAIIAACLTLTQAEARFGAIGRAVQNACRELVQDGPTPSISMGVAECSAGDTLESLQRRADEALYQAKNNGKGRLATKASPFIRDLRKDR